MMDFPSSPTTGQLYPASPVAGMPTYKWDGEKWGPATAVAGTYVLKTGDTMSGPLAITDTTAASTPTTGALTVAGGLGAGGAIVSGSTIASVAPAGGAAGFYSRIPTQQWSVTTRANGYFEIADETNPNYYLTIVPGAPGFISIPGVMNVLGANTKLQAAGTLRLAYNPASSYAVSFQPNGSDVGTSIIFVNNAQTTYVGTISHNATTTAYNTSSDVRLKDDLRPLDAGPVIDATKVYDFAWRETGVRGHGVVAQEAVRVYPRAITHDKIADWWGVDYSKYVPLLLQEAKALRARVATLEQRLSHG
jgi:hypothetical protein